MSSLQLRPLQWPSYISRIASLVDPARTYLVGGCVRDAVCGRSIKDIDLLTLGDGRKTAKDIANALGGAYFPLDEQRMIGRALVGHDAHTLHIDVASLRAEDLEGDLGERDFTINAMAVPLNDLQNVIDPLDGITDLLRTRTLRYCNSESIQSDPVRCLRAVRISMDFGLRIEQLTRESIRAGAQFIADHEGNLHQPERIRDEVFKLFDLNRPYSALQIMNYLGVTKPVLGPLDHDRMTALEGRIRITQHLADLFSVIGPLRTDNTGADLILGVAVMTLDRVRADLQSHIAREHASARLHSSLITLACLTSGVYAHGFIPQRFKLSADESSILGTLASKPLDQFDANEPFDDRQIHRFFRDTGACGVDHVLIWLAEFLAWSDNELDVNEWGRRLTNVASPLLFGYFRRYEEVIRPKPIVTGNTLQGELGIKPGPRIGSILRQLLEEQAAGQISTKFQALNYARQLIRQSER